MLGMVGAMQVMDVWEVIETRTTGMIQLFSRLMHVSSSFHAYSEQRKLLS